MSKAKTERYDVTVQGGGHGMTTDPLDGLEQLRRIIDEQPEPAPESVMLGLDYCYAEWVAERARHAEEVARLRDVHLDETRALDDLRLKEIASLRDQLREVTMERENRVAEMRAWGEAKLAGAQHEITHLRDRLREVTAERDRERERATKMEAELDARRAHDEDVRACAEYCRNMIGPPPGMPVEDYPLPPVALAARRILAALDSQGGEGECLDRSDARGVAGDRCESGNECGRLGCPECQS